MPSKRVSFRSIDSQVARCAIRLAVCLAFFAPALVTAHAAAVSKRPNIVLIYADDLGYGDLGCYGATSVQTPNIDRLGKEGLRFINAYCSSATCTPSRYSLLTGEYAFRKKGTGILPGDASLIIEPGRDTLPAMLQRAGYRTAAVGKWHLGLGSAKQQPLNWNGDITPGPLEVGFNYSFIMAATADRVPCVYIEDHRVVGLLSDEPMRVSYEENFQGEPDGVKNRNTLKLDWSHGHNQAVVNGIGRIGYMTGGKHALWKDEEMADEFTRHALDFMEREKEHPFFLYFATHDIHVPRVPHPRFAGKTSMGARGDAIVELDHAVGEILKKLEALKLAENTMVIFSSDNGPVLDDGYKDGANETVGTHKPAGILRGGKYSLFEGGTRVPLITYWPGNIKPGDSDALVSQVDFAATLAALAQEKTDTNAMRDSQNVLSALLGKSKTGRDHIIEYADGIALREGNWKFMPPGQTREHLGPWKAVKIPPPGFLCDLSADPGETTNLAAQHPDKVQAMAARLREVTGRNKLAAEHPE